MIPFHVQQLVVRGTQASRFSAAYQPDFRRIGEIWYQNSWSPCIMRYHITCAGQQRAAAPLPDLSKRLWCRSSISWPSELQVFLVLISDGETVRSEGYHLPRPIGLFKATMRSVTIFPCLMSNMIIRPYLSVVRAKRAAWERTKQWWWHQRINATRRGGTDLQGVLRYHMAWHGHMFKGRT